VDRFFPNTILDGFSWLIPFNGGDQICKIFGDHRMRNDVRGAIFVKCH